MVKEENTSNNVFQQSQQLKEMFTIGNYFIHPHVIHLSHPELVENNLWHTHHTLEYSYLLSGNMKYYIDGSELDLKSGDSVIIPSGIRHYWKNISRRSKIFGVMLYVSCQGDGAMLHMEYLQNGIKENSYCIRNFSMAESIIKKIIAITKKPEGYFGEKILCLTRELYIEIFNIVAPAKSRYSKKQASLRLRGEDTNDIAETVEYYVNDNLQFPIRPSDICHHVGLSINYLNSVLKQQGRGSLGQIIIERKLSVASDLLSHTNRLIKDISSTVGIENVDYFCRIFKKHNGLSPSEFRKQRHNHPKLT